MDRRHVTSASLEWRQPRMFAQEYELRDGDEFVAKLTFRSAFGTLAEGQSADGCWTFKRVGFWTPRVTVRVNGQDADIAAFENNTWASGGTLRLGGGRELQASTNFWDTRWQFQTPAEEPLVSFEVEGLLHRGAHVTVAPAAVLMAELPWLLMLGWYLIVLRDRDAAAVIIS